MLRDVPLFARHGAVIPTTEVADTAGDQPFPDLTLLSVGATTSRTTVHDVDGDTTVEAVRTEDALALLRQQPFDLVLVNRVLDADGTSGQQLIDKIKADEKLKGVPVMLVSNYDNYQKDAVKAGALPGFGKATLGSPATVARLKKYLA